MARMRKSSKPALAKAKRMVTKNRKAKAKRNMDTYFLKTKTNVTLSPSQGGVASNFIYRVYNLDPTEAGDSALYLKNAEFALWKLQYDKFRVNSVKVTVVPKANILDQAVAQNDGQFNTSGDGLVHTCIDRDGPAPSSTAIIMRYPSYRKYSILKPFTRTYAIKYPTGVWIDCGAPGQFSMATELGLKGSITLYAENILEDTLEVFNEPWATVSVEYNIVFQGKSSNSYSGVYDGEGNLTGVTINAVNSLDILPMSPQTMVSGTLSSDTRTKDDATKPYTDVPVNDLGIEV